MTKNIALLIFILFIYSCAQQTQPLTGGPQDTIAPEIIKSIPAFKDTSFNDDKIIIKFDEYVQLNNIDQNFFASPPFSEKPKFKLNGKKIIIHFQENLKDSITYTLKFGDAIVDLNEKNVLKNYKFIFSTYSELDTLKISGTLIDAYTLKPVNNGLVMLYDKNKDSLPIKEIPLYATLTDTTGKFEFTNIKPKNYKIFALLDLNNNYKFDEDENQIAFQDSLILPYAKLITKYDTLDSGSVVTKILNDTTINDTLKIDSIKITNFTEFYPNKLNLFFYTEEGINQEIKRKKRTVKGGVKLFFTKQLFNNYIEINQIDKTSDNDFKHIFEKFPSKDSVFIWFQNPNFYNKDTLKFSITYYLNDSLKTTDTLIFTDYDYETDSIPLFLFPLKQSISISSDFVFSLPNPIANIDTSKIKLFKIIDTLVADAKEQKVSVFRPAYDSLVFVFSRPTSDNFSLVFDKIENSQDVYVWKKNSANDTVLCKITSHSLIERDTIKLSAYYDNMFFFNQLVKHEQQFNIPITFQKIKKVYRPTQDSILVTFQKDLPKKVKCQLLDFSQNDYSFSFSKNILKIKLTNKIAIAKDTLFLAFNVSDMKLLNGDEKIYIDTVKAIFVFNRQKTTFSRRYLRSKMILAFNKPLLETPKLELLSFNPLNKWYTTKTNANKDTLFVDIHNERVKRLNDMRLAVQYYDINQHNDTLYFSDTLKLKIENIKNNTVQIIGREISLKLKEPVKFKINRDSVFLRRYCLDANFIANHDYFLEFDSSAIRDIYNITNDTSKLSFKVFAPENYATLVLDIQNIWAILDSVGNIDTSEFFVLPKGQAILVIEDENHEIYKTQNIISNKILKDATFLPGKYTLKIYYDENQNNRWDPGNYFKHIQPEKVFIYKKILNLSEGSEEKIMWDLSEFIKDSN